MKRFYGMIFVLAGAVGVMQGADSKKGDGSEFIRISKAELQKFQDAWVSQIYALQREVKLLSEDNQELRERSETLEKVIARSESDDVFNPDYQEGEQLKLYKNYIKRLKLKLEIKEEEVRAAATKTTSLQGEDRVMPQRFRVKSS